MSTPPPLPAFNPYAAPVARIQDDAFAELELADRGIRLVAVLIDTATMMVAVLPMLLMMPFMAPRGDAAGPDEALLVAGIGLMFVVWLALAIWNMIWLHRYGQTVGKRVMKIRVLRSDGSHCALLRIIFARWLPVAMLGMIPLLGYVFSLLDPLMIFREDRRCLHDLIADTIVVRA